MLKLAKITLSLVLFIAFSNGVQSQTILTAESDTICAGDSIRIFATGNTSFAWSPSTGLDTIIGDTVWANLSSSTTYTVIGTTGMSSDTTNITITVNGRPTISVSASMDTVCSGKQVDFVGSGAMTYTWMGATATSTSGDSATASPTTSGYIYVMGADSNSCSQSDSVHVEVKALPSVSIIAPTFVCANTPKEISAMGADSYVWSPSTAFNVDTGSTVIINIPSGLSISVIGTAANGCSKSANRTLLVNTTAPAVLAFAADTITCEGDSVLLSAIGTTADSYLWKDLSGNSLLASGMQDVYATPTVNTTFRVISEKNGCADSSEVAIEVNPIPSISLSQSSGGATLCQDVADTISVTSNGVLFFWNIPGSSVTTSSKTKAIAPGITTSIEVVAVSDKGCQNGSIVTINVDTSCGEKLSVEDLDRYFNLNYRSSERIFVLSSETNVSVESLELFDLQGKSLQRSSTSNQLEVPEMIPGIYLLRAKTAQGVLSKKFYLE